MIQGVSEEREVKSGNMMEKINYKGKHFTGTKEVVNRFNNYILDNGYNIETIPNMNAFVRIYHI